MRRRFPTVLDFFRGRLGIRARNDEEREWFENSGWMDVWVQVTCFTIWSWFWSEERRLQDHQEFKLYSVPDGSRIELMRYVFRPRKLNFRRGAWSYPRKSLEIRAIPDSGLFLIEKRD